MKTKFVVLPLLLSCLSLGSPALQASPRFVPTEQVLLSNTVTENGLVSVNLLAWQGSLDEAMNDLERQWADPVMPPMREKKNGWDSITRKDGQVIETIQLRSTPNGVEGRRIRLTPQRDAGKSLEADARWAQALLPPRTRLTPSVRHADGDSQLSSFVAYTDDSVVNVLGWVAHRLQAQGFSELMRAPSKPGAGSQSAFFGKGKEEVEVTSTRTGNRQFIVIHWKH